MAKKWAKFPHADKAYAYDAAGLKKNWARLHKGDGEPFPKDAAVLEAWFAALAEGGVANDPLQKRPWGAHDGQVTDRFGVRQELAALVPILNKGISNWRVDAAATAAQAAPWLASAPKGTKA